MVNESSKPGLCPIEQAINRMKRLAQPVVLCLLAFLCVGGQPTSSSRPGSDLDYWLSRAKDADTQPATQAAGRNPFRRGADTRQDALPGVVELSNGRRLAGGILTTYEKPWQVYDKQTGRWRRVPAAAVLSITAVVVEEKMELKWRWKAMGEPERVYTGESYPTRRLRWKFHLVDDSSITGTVKGQPMWVRSRNKKAGPFVLHERSRGTVAQKLADLIYVKRVFISLKLMEKVLTAQATSQPSADK